MTDFDPLWESLKRIRVVEFVANSRSETGWQGSGSGIVVVEIPSPTTLVFRESGLWRPASGRELRFQNVYRWSRMTESVCLEHLRFGEAHPVYLFDLAPASNNRWASVTPHLCREDAYSALLEIEERQVSLAWSVIGPDKNEEIRYRYSPLLPVFDSP